MIKKLLQTLTVITICATALMAAAADDMIEGKRPHRICF